MSSKQTSVVKVLLLFELLLIFSGCSSSRQTTKPGYEEVPVPKNIISDEYPKPDVWAKYPGGQEGVVHFFAKNSHFWGAFLRKGVNGRVIITYVVDVDGSVKNVKALMSPSEEITKRYKELILSMDPWKPAILGGKPVEQRYIFVLRAGGDWPEPVESDVQQN